MAMVQHLIGAKLTNRNITEDDSHVSEHSGDSNSRPSSRSSNKSKRSSPGPMPQYQYSREELMKISKVKLAKERPTCLDLIHNNSSGKWDPERWFLNKRGDKPPVLDEPRCKRERQESDISISHKKRSSDPKERVKEEKDEIVLSPQRRSFGTGCHVIQQSPLARRPGSPNDLRDSESYREPNRRIGSGRIMTRDREQRDWDRDRDYGYGGGRRDRFDQDDSEKDLRRYSNRYGRGDRRSSRGHERIEEEEPEWYSSGPTSQSETIELVGFDDAGNEGENKKTNKRGNRKIRENTRKQNLLTEGEKTELPIVHPPPPVDRISNESERKGEVNKSKEKSKSNTPESLPDLNDVKNANANFDFEEVLKMDWLPGLLSHESSHEMGNDEIACSRFTQWFKRESPVLGLQGSGDNSRRSSLQEELIAHVLSGIGEPQLLIPSPPPNSDSYFAPISPALTHANYCIPPPHPTPCSENKDILHLLKTANVTNRESIVNGDHSKIHEKVKQKSVRELEADLKRIVLGEKAQEDRSAFDKLLQQMTDADTTTSISIGPLDKSKALQEEDLLQSIMQSGTLSSPTSNRPQVSRGEKSISPQISNIGGLSRSQFFQQQPPQNDVFSQLLHQQQEHQQQLQAQQQRQMQQAQQHSQSQGLNVQGFTVDMLAKLLGTQQAPPQSPLSPGLHQSVPQHFDNRNEHQALTNMLQQQRQRELLSSLLKQQQQTNSQVLTSSGIQSRSHPKDATQQQSSSQTLGLPTIGARLSPRQSPLPSETIGSVVSSQGRVPSPLVFGQQPPALSHAPAPIHPAHLAQAVAQNASANSNTLQVQNALVLQRVPSPQELAVHTQSILQNALIKRKLEEQKENYRKRQEAQRTNSPVVSGSKNGISTSPHKGLSPIAFTPTSVMRKMQSERSEKDGQQKNEAQNGSHKMMLENRPLELNQNTLKPSSINVSTATAGVIPDSIFGNGNHHEETASHGSSGSNLAGPRPLHGQGASNQARLQHTILHPVPAVTSQGRPIVKGGNLQSNISCCGDHNRTPANKNVSMLNKILMPTNAQQINTGLETVNKVMEQQRLLHQQQSAALAQRQQSASPMAPLHSTAFGLRPRGPGVPSHHPNLVRPLNIGPAAVGAPNINYNLLQMMQTNPYVRAQARTFNPLTPLSQLAAIQQLQRNNADCRQIQAVAHPLTFHQLFETQAQISAGLVGVRGDGKQHLIPAQPSTNRQSPVNLAKWFGNDVLKQKMPEMPPMSHQKALLVEEVERQQQQSAAVHN